EPLLLRASSLLGRHHATETDVIRPAVRIALPARPDFVGRAVLIGTQIGAAAHHTFSRARFAGVVTIVRTLGITGRLLPSRELAIVIVPIPVGAPLPDVACHIEESVAVGWERANRRRRLVAVFPGVLDGESSLPDIRHPCAPRFEVIAPGVCLA